MKWVEHVASFAGDKGKGLLACAVGKIVHLFDQAATKLKAARHIRPSVTGLAFDAKGKRVAASHYNGAIAVVRRGQDRQRRAGWNGRAATPASPFARRRARGHRDAGKRAARLAAVRRPAHADERLSGEDAEPLVHPNGKWLASSGADSVVLWPFTGGGPMGKAPTEVAGGDGVLCTRVACHPTQEIVAAAFNDGLVVVAEIASGRIAPIAPPGNGPVSALAWSPDGAQSRSGRRRDSRRCSICRGSDRLRRRRSIDGRHKTRQTKGTA